MVLVVASAVAVALVAVAIFDKATVSVPVMLHL